LIACLISAAGIAITLRLPAVYKAEALVLVDPQKVPEKFVTSTVTEDVQDRMATINQEILSSTRLKEIIDDFNLYSKQRKTQTMEEVIARMRTDIDIKLEKGLGGNRPGAFRVTYQGPDPNVVADVVNRITALYIKENYRSRSNQAAGTADFIQRQLDDAKTELDKQEQAVSVYKLQHNGQLPEQENSLIATMSRLQMELQGNQDALNRSQQDKLSIDSSLNAAEAAEANLRQSARPVVSSNGTVTFVDDGTPARPPRKSELLQAELASMRLRYSDDYPDVKRLQNQIAAYQALEQKEDAARAALLARNPGLSAKASTPAPDPTNDALTAERIRTHERVTALKSQLALVLREIQKRSAEHERILRDLASYQQRVEQLPVREQEMAALTRNYEFSKAIYRSLLDKKYAAEMATDLEKRQKAETFRILDAAKPPQKPFKPKREMLIAMSVIAGILLGISCAIAQEVKAGVLLGSWELPAGTVVLCEVPPGRAAFTAITPPHLPDAGSGQPSPSSRRAIISSSTALSLLMTAALVFHRL
jgi:polysaccharide chain length determinant protein (PEP-CTERM system associated)